MRPLMRNSHDPAAAGIFERILDGIIISFAWTKCCQKESGRPSSLFCLKILSPGESAMARPQRDQKISGTRQDGLSTGQQRHYLYVRRSHAHRSEKQLYPLHLI